MNERLTEIYRSCRSKEALASQDQFQSANALLGSEVEQFARAIVLECDRYARSTWEHGELLGGDLKTLFGIE